MMPQPQAPASGPPQPSNVYPASTAPYPPLRPSTGPGSGFPARSGLAGMQPHSMAMAPGSGSGVRGGLPEEKNVAQIVQENTSKWGRRVQAMLDRSTPFVTERWVVTSIIFVLFGLSVVLRQGWYIVAYALAIYILNLFLAFLQPRFDPSTAADIAESDVEEGAPGLPGASSSSSKGGLNGLIKGFSNSNNEDEEEFRPFIRRLPEFKFWLAATRATTIALGCTITRATDVPVYWPILLVYFLTLFGITMRRQIQHMVQHKYVPWSKSKPRFR